MKAERCGDTNAHGQHEWYWKNILRRECPGWNPSVAFCNNNETHAPHWHGEHRDEWCRGSGLAGVCEHGEQALNECDDCAAVQ